MVHNFEKYCKCYEKIENFEKAKADNFKGWHVHHRLETHFSSGKRRSVNISAEELKSLGMYYRRPAEELVFLTSSEHNRLHHKGKQLTGEVKKKLSEARKNMSEETKKKIGAAKKGTRWFNNGKINVRAKECPEGFTPGRLKKRP